MDNLYPSQYKFKYPKAGEENSIIKINDDINTKKTTDLKFEKDYPSATVIKLEEKTLN